MDTKPKNSKFERNTTRLFIIESFKMYSIIPTFY